MQPHNLIGEEIGGLDLANASCLHGMQDSQRIASLYVFLVFRHHQINSPRIGGALALRAHCALLFRRGSPGRVPKHTPSKRPYINPALGDVPL